MAGKFKADVRLAFRIEGEMWNAYLAPHGTMEGSVLLGSIWASTVQENDARRDAFVVLMRDIVDEYLLRTYGKKGTWGEWERAPEQERGGRA